MIAGDSKVVCVFAPRRASTGLTARGVFRGDYSVLLTLPNRRESLQPLPPALQMQWLFLSLPSLLRAVLSTLHVQLTLNNSGWGCRPCRCGVTAVGSLPRNSQPRIQIQWALGLRGFDLAGPRTRGFFKSAGKWALSSSNPRCSRAGCITPGTRRSHETHYVGEKTEV